MNELTVTGNMIERVGQNILNDWYAEHSYIIDRGGSCIGYDLLLNDSIKVEEKYRAQEYPDFLVETVQNDTKNELGWVYHTQADWIVYLSGNNLYIVKWLQFFEWFCDNRDKYKDTRSNAGYGKSRNKAIPWTDIPNHLFKQFTLKQNFTQVLKAYEDLNRKRGLELYQQKFKKEK